MFGMRNLVLAAVSAAGVLGTAGIAEAQYYYPYEQPRPRYVNPHYYQQPPVYVPPRVLRKQAQQRERFIQKYGYQQPQQYYYQQPAYGYRQPRRNLDYDYGPRGIPYSAPGIGASGRYGSW